MERATYSFKENENVEGQEARRITILIVDDHPFVRQALRILLGAEPDMQIIGEASNGVEAVAMASELKPDVVIMDIGMPLLNGLEATRRIKKNCPGIAILVLTVFADNQHVLGILQAGAAGYLTKEVFGENVIKGIRAIRAGEAVLTPSILQQIITSMPAQKARKDPQAVPKNLTARDLQILKLIARGMCNKEIASEVSITVTTVKANLTAIFNKLGVSSRTEAVVTGLKSEILTIEDLG
ncbi:MAG TPA: response regulator transcription factor [Dehalococcoidales bacterium]|nr:response regulator transcription factor [Dehalococcoidales bacterium]